MVENFSGISSNSYRLSLAKCSLTMLNLGIISLTKPINAVLSFSKLYFIMTMPYSQNIQVTFAFELSSLMWGENSGRASQNVSQRKKIGYFEANIFLYKP